MYIHGSTANLAEFFLSNLHFQQQLTGMVCFNSVLYCLRVASFGKFFSRDAFSGKEEATTILFTGAPTIYHYSRITNDCVVGIFRKFFSDKPFELSHVMISVNSSGICIGSNNGAIGGQPNWDRVDLSRQLTWRSNVNPLYNDPGQPSAPDWAKERVVLVKPISEILRGVI